MRADGKKKKKEKREQNQTVWKISGQDNRQNKRGNEIIEMRKLLGKEVVAGKFAR